MSEDALTQQSVEPRTCAPSRSAGGLSPKERRLFGASSKGALVSFCTRGAALAHRANRPSGRGHCTD
eukprot:2965304-Alexandrium_andersonii.AAC.1